MKTAKELIGHILKNIIPVSEVQYENAEKASKEINDILAELKLKTELLEELYKYCDDGSAAFDDPHEGSIFIRVADALDEDKETD